jgi:hypothetical protein
LRIQQNSSRETELVSKKVQQQSSGMYAGGVHTPPVSSTFSRDQAVEVVQRWDVPGSTHSSSITFYPAHVIRQEGSRVLVQMDDQVGICTQLYANPLLSLS